MALSFTFNPFTGNFDAVSTVSLAAVGSSPNNNAASISNDQVLTLQPADATHPGVITAGTQTMAGAKTFSTSVLSPIFSTNAANPAASGTLRLANAGQVNWRNSTNDGDVQLYVDSNNDLIFTSGNVVNLDCDLYATGLQLKDADNSDTVGLFAAPVTTSYSITFPAAAPVSASNLLTIDNVGQLGYTQSSLPPATGTSGGIPYYNSTTSLASSALLAANQLVLGGGAGTAPATLGSLGTTTTVLHGNAAGAPTFGAVSLTADVSGTLPVANGGTGAASLTSNNVILGNGTSAVQFVAPGTSGNVLTSNGTTWTSAASGGDVTLGTFGSAPNANGASLSGQQLTLQPADGTNPGGVSTTTQTFAGVKTFSSEPSVPSLDFTSNSKILSGTANPTSSATSGNPGSLYLNSSTGVVYAKQDSGSTTNWSAIANSAVVTAWQSYTPTLTGFGTTTNVQFRYRQVGTSIEIQGGFNSGTPTVTEARVSLPGSAVSSSSYPSIQIVGHYGNNKGNDRQHGGNILIETSVGYITFSNMETFSGQTANALTKVNATSVVESGDRVSLIAVVECSGLTGVTPNPGTYQAVTIRDQKSAGTAGGTFTSGSDQTRDLNTLDNPLSASWISLSSNQFTLSAGTYQLSADAPAFNVSYHRALLYNTSDSSVVAYGSNAYTASGSTNPISESHVKATFTIASSKTFEIRHRCSNTQATTGFGLDNATSGGIGGTNVFTVVNIIKIG